MLNCILTDDDCERIAIAIAEKINKAPTSDKILWDSKDCGSYLKCTAKHFTDRISKHHTFPIPIMLPSEKGRKARPRWYAIEVIEWVKKQRG